MSALCGLEDPLPHVMAVSMLVQPDFFPKATTGHLQMVHTNAGCHHTGPVLSIWAPQQVTEDHSVQQEGHSQRTCPSSGSSSHIRKQGEIKVYFRSYQVRDSKSSSNQLGHQKKYHKPSRALTWVLVNKLINLLLPEVKNYLTNYLNEG